MDFATDNDSWVEVFAAGPVCILKFENIVGEWPVLEATSNVEELTGWSVDEFVSGKVNIGDIIHPEDKERIDGEEEEWIAAGYTYNGISNYRIITKTGQIRHICEFAQGVFGDDGNIKYVIGYMTDVAAVRDEEIERTYREVESTRKLPKSPPISGKL